MNIIQKLTHGKALLKNNFPFFVETFNNIVDRSYNIKGDADIDPSNGHIKVDNKNENHPVIRFVNPFEGGSGEQSFRIGRFAIDEDWNIINKIMYVGTKIVDVESEYQISDAGIVALKIPAQVNSTGDENIQFENYDDWDLLKSAADNPEYAIIPLYKITNESDLAVEIDLRFGPIAPMWEW